MQTLQGSTDAGFPSFRGGSSVSWPLVLIFPRVGAPGNIYAGDELTSKASLRSRAYSWFRPSRLGLHCFLRKTRSRKSRQGLESLINYGGKVTKSLKIHAQRTGPGRRLTASDTQNQDIPGAAGRCQWLRRADLSLEKMEKSRQT